MNRDLDEAESLREACVVVQLSDPHLVAPGRLLMGGIRAAALALVPNWRVKCGLFEHSPRAPAP